MYSNGQLVMEDMDTFEDILDDFEMDENNLSEQRRRSRQMNRQPSRQTRPMMPMIPGGSSANTKLALLENKVNALEGRVNTLGNSMRDGFATAASALKKETQERKKADQQISGDLRQKIMLLTLLPALSRPSSRTIQVPSTTGTGTESVQVLVESNDSMSMLLPLLLVGGLDGNSGFGGSSGSGNTNNNSDMTMILLVLAMSGGFGRSGR